MRATLTTLQAGRAVAALAVLLYHAAQATETRVEAFPAGLARVLGYGFLGVDLFFVLSGFIILHAHWDDRSGMRPALAQGSAAAAVSVRPVQLGT